MTEAAGAEPIGRPRGPRWVVAIAVAAFAFLFAFAAVHLGRVRWYPVLDLALTELRIRDVWSSHPPLVGLIGRIGEGSAQGSHPGPLSFYVLWPFYQVFGGSAWAMEAATSAVNVVAIGVSLWAVFRRGGAWAVGALAAALALAINVFGPVTLTQPWNPYLPILWWIAFVVAVWSVLCDDLVLLPVVVFTGSLCVQTHISYTVIVAVPLVAVVVALVRFGRRERATTGKATRVGRWLGLSLALGVVLWIPPLVQQAVGSPGNLWIIFRYFTNPPESAIGLASGGRFLLRHLDLWSLVDRHDGVTGSALPGAALLVVWAALALATWRVRRRPALNALNLVLAISLLAGLFSLSRIFGPPFWYLMLWGWSIACLLLFSSVLSIGVLVPPAVRASRATRAIAAVALVSVVVAASWGFLDQTSGLAHPSAADSTTLSRLVPETVRHLRSGAGGGPRGHFLVTWYDPIGLGGIGYGMVDELERAGFDVGTIRELQVAATGHRVMPLVKATAEVHVSFGSDIDRWRANPKTVEVASFDRRTPLQRALSERLRRDALAGLVAAGIAHPARALEGNAFVLLTDPRLSPSTRSALRGYLALGLPVAVFVAPPGSFDRASSST